MEEFFAQFWLNHWAWFLAAILFLALELFAPGILFMWMAIAAAIVAVVDLVIPSIGWQVQIVLFVVLSFVTVVLGRRYVQRNPVETEDPTLNRRGEQYIGKTYEVVEAISGGSGRIKVGDSMWRAEGPDAPAGTKVRVTGVAGAALKVEPAA